LLVTTASTNINPVEDAVNKIVILWGYTKQVQQEFFMSKQQIKYKGTVYRLADRSELRHPRMPPNPQEAAHEVHVVYKTMLEHMDQLHPILEQLLTKYTSDLGDQPDSIIIRKFNEALMMRESTQLSELLADLRRLGTYALHLTLPIVKGKPVF
jgi:hypothetical protein